jgi:RNA polymerase sigma factor (sigma-70 family)
MQAMDDTALLREYAASNSEAAFAELVSRRAGLVYSAALRQVGDPHLAEEVTQVVFIILAQKARQFSEKTILAGWLFKTTRFVALAQSRAIAKRHKHDEEIQMQSAIRSTAPDPLWEQMSPLLDQALAALGEKDREAVLLRFFENRSLAEVGNALGAGEDAARKRVRRSLEKLRRFFLKRGVASTATTIAGLLSVKAVHAAPATLAKSVTSAAVVKGAVSSGSTLTLIKGASKLMTLAKAKTVALGSVVAVSIVTTTTLLINQSAQSEGKQSGTPKDWPREALTNAGRATPETALKTLLWAVSTANSNTISSSLSAEFQVKAQKIWKESLARLKKQIDEAQGFRILSVSPPDDTVIIDLYSKGRQRARQYSFQKIGDEWKCNNIWTERAFLPPSEDR